MLRCPLSQAPAASAETGSHGLQERPRDRFLKGNKRRIKALQAILVPCKYLWSAAGSLLQRKVYGAATNPVSYSLPDRRSNRRAQRSSISNKSPRSCARTEAAVFPPRDGSLQQPPPHQNQRIFHGP